MTHNQTDSIFRQRHSNKFTDSDRRVHTYTESIRFRQTHTDSEILKENQTDMESHRKFPSLQMSAKASKHYDVLQRATKPSGA